MQFPTLTSKLLTTLVELVFDKVVPTIFRWVFRQRRLSEGLKFGHDVIVTVNTMNELVYLLVKIRGVLNKK